MSISRWLYFEGYHLSAVANILPASIFYLIGLCDVLLFMYTRQGLLLFPKPAEEESPTLSVTEDGITNGGPVDEEVSIEEGR
jgi:hypothetical protein